MSPWRSIVARVGRLLVVRDLTGYGVKIETTPAGLKVVFPNGTIWLVRVAVSAVGDPPRLSDAEQQALVRAAGELGGVPVVARVRLAGSGRDRGPRIRYYDLRASRETHPGLFLLPGG